MKHPFNTVMLEGNEQIIAFTPIRGLSGAQWYIDISIDHDKAHAAQADLHRSAVFATLITVAIIVALLGSLMHLLMRHLRTQSSLKVVFLFLASPPRRTHTSLSSVQ